MIKLGNSFVFFIVFIVLQACSGSQKFNTNKEVINPFTIYSYQNLSLPPIYYLSSKEIIDRRKYLLSKQRSYQYSLLSSMYGKITDIKNISQSDNQLLKMAKADSDYSFIRETVNQESLYLIKKDSSFINKIFSNYKRENLENAFSEYTITNKR